MNLERQKENFKDHKATFTDFGNIKILDFQKPNSNSPCIECPLTGI